MGLSASNIKDQLLGNESPTAKFLYEAIPVLAATKLFEFWILDSKDAKTKSRLDDFVALGLSIDIARRLAVQLPEDANYLRSLLWLLPIVATFRGEISEGAQWLLKDTSPGAHRAGSNQV